jgi:hypothetical protein
VLTLASVGFRELLIDALDAAEEEADETPPHPPPAPRYIGQKESAP